MRERFSNIAFLASSITSTLLVVALIVMGSLAIAYATNDEAVCWCDHCCYQMATIMSASDCSSTYSPPAYMPCNAFANDEIVSSGFSAFSAEDLSRNGLNASSIALDNGVLLYVVIQHGRGGPVVYAFLSASDLMAFIARFANAAIALAVLVGLSFVLFCVAFRRRLQLNTCCCCCPSLDNTLAATTSVAATPTPTDYETTANVVARINEKDVEEKKKKRRRRRRRTTSTVN
jgi:hypothetical protein